MKHKNIFLKSTLILIIGGVITKILGFIVRIIYTRIVGTEVIGLYSLVTPTYSLLITIATLSLPITISKLIAENKHNNLQILSTATVLIMVINFFVMSTVFLGARFIANTLLHEERCYLLIIAMALTFPVISISSIIKGYFYGKQNMYPNVISNIIEEIVRITLIYIFVPKAMAISDIFAAASLFVITFVEEVVSIFVNLLFIPKHFKITKSNIKPNIPTLKSILNISIPTGAGRLIGNIGYFFEPIILKNLLLYMGYTNNYILVEYGAYNAYSITILTMPSFFITAISSSLIPEISKFYLVKNKKMVKKRLKEAIIFALIIGISYSILLIFSGKFILETLYNTTKGLNYINILAPIFPIFYIENILMSFMQAIDKAKTTMKITIIGVIIKIVSLILFSLLDIGMYALVLSEIANILIVVSLNIYYTRKYLKAI